jgi:CRP/FNR family transcriptional regulator
MATMAGSQVSGRFGTVAGGSGQATGGFAALPLAGCDRRFNEDETMFLEDDPALDVYEVTEGVVRLCKLLPDGRRAIVGFLYPGELAGLSAGGQYSLTAEAVTPVTVRSCSRRTLDRAADGSPDVQRRLSAFLWRELEAAQSRLVLLGRMSAVERVASFLMTLWLREHGTNSVHLPMSRLDIADYLGLTIETVSRTLSQLRRQGVIALPTPHEVMLLRPAVLRALAGEGEADPQPRAA